MNNVKRKELAKISVRLSQARDMICDIKGDIEYVLIDEEDTLNNMERFSGTERYIAMEDAVSDMGDAVGSLEEAIDEIDSAIESIDNAQK